MRQFRESECVRGGSVLQHQVELGQAVESCRKAVALQPDNPDAYSNLASALLEQGHLDEAAECYRKLLGFQPHNPEAYTGLGSALEEQGHLHHAVECYRRAIAIKPDDPDAYRNLGDALQRLGNLDEPVDCYRKMIALQPDYPNAHNNLGVALQRQGDLDQAVECYRKAIALEPDHLNAHNNLGNVLQLQGHLDQAVECYRKVIAIKPDHPDAHYKLGVALQQRQGHLDEAVECHRKAIALQPDHPDAYSNLGSALVDQGHADEALDCYRRADNNLGKALYKKGQMDQAAQCFRRAIAIKPDDPDAYSRLGCVLDEKGHLDQAVACFRRAIALQPDHLNAHSNLGSTLQRQGHLDQAIECYRKAIAIKPDHADAHHSLALALHTQEHLDQAVECYRKVLAIEPDNADAHHNLAFALLTRGDLAEGWKEYEWRWRGSQMVPRGFIEPQWQGEAAEGKTLLVHVEQGFGDAIQFCRYAPLAAARGLRVIVEAREPLIRLFRSLPKIHDVVVRGKELPHFDLHCPMMSMPLALGTTLGNIPSVVPYLYADEAQVANWRTRLAAMGKHGPRIGLVWAGSSGMKANNERSLPSDRIGRLLGPLLDLPGMRFFSLQKDGPKAPEELSLTDLMDEVNDFADTAALIASLDLVISVCTSTAHLAGALGKPVWVLNRFNSHWCWFRGRSDSPWYPTLRLYRQPRPGDWDSVLAYVARDLRYRFPAGAMAEQTPARLNDLVIDPGAAPVGQVLPAVAAS
jgi:tetratricopeptide (TPR) repeat protein